MKKEIKQIWHFNQPPQDVWEYLTQSELLEQWLGKVDFRPVAGHQFSISGKGGCLIYCEVLTVQPFTQLSYSWQYASVKEPEKRFDSKVVWTLTPTVNGATLELLHNGFELMEDHDSHNNGWQTLGRRLSELLNVAV